MNAVIFMAGNERYSNHYLLLWVHFTSCAVFGKCYRSVKLAAVLRCDIPADFPQVWASSFLPNEPALAERCQREYKQKHGEPMLLQYARMEAQAQVTQQIDMEINTVI